MKKIAKIFFFLSKNCLFFWPDYTVAINETERQFQREEKMHLAPIFESLMLICFGFSWPLNVLKAYKARTAKGTSLPFILLIITGYIAGITAKFLNHSVSYVLVVYFLNLIIVSTNLLVYFRNRALDKRTAVISYPKQENLGA